MNEKSCGCVLKCCEKLSTDKRKAIHQRFWAMGNFDVQNPYICGCIQVKPVQRHYSPAGSSSTRGNTRLYYIRDGEYSVRVCKSAFLLMHGLSNGHAIEGIAQTGGFPKLDQCGIREHIESATQATIRGPITPIANISPRSVIVQIVLAV